MPERRNVACRVDASQAAYDARRAREAQEFLGELYRVRVSATANDSSILR